MVGRLYDARSERDAGNDGADALFDAAGLSIARSAMLALAARVRELEERIEELRTSAIRRVQTAVAEIRRDLNGIIEERDADVAKLSAKVTELEAAAEDASYATKNAKAMAHIANIERLKMDALVGSRDINVARLSARIAELEDTVDLERAQFELLDDDLYAAFAKDAAATIAAIEARRGAGWKGGR
jgi:DNA repair exonuclease SbcCD ATPase subunit